MFKPYAIIDQKTFDAEIQNLKKLSLALFYLIGAFFDLKMHSVALQSIK